MMFASHRAVVLHGAELIKEAFNHPSFAGRPPKEAGIFISGGINGTQTVNCVLICGIFTDIFLYNWLLLGIVLANGRVWNEQRRFTMRHLREFGFGKTDLESLILDEVTELVNWIKEQNEKPVEIRRRFSLASINILWTMLSGERYEQGDPKMTGLLDQFEEYVSKNNT